MVLKNKFRQLLIITWLIFFIKLQLNLDQLTNRFGFLFYLGFIVVSVLPLIIVNRMKIDSKTEDNYVFYISIGNILLNFILELILKLFHNC